MSFSLRSKSNATKSHHLRHTKSRNIMTILFKWQCAGSSHLGRIRKKLFNGIHSLTKGWRKCPSISEFSNFHTPIRNLCLCSWVWPRRKDNAGDHQYSFQLKKYHTSKNLTYDRGYALNEQSTHHPTETSIVEAEEVGLILYHRNWWDLCWLWINFRCSTP